MAQSENIPKHHQIHEALVRVLEGKQPGDRLPSLRALKAQFGVSQSTLERCLDGLVREGRVRRKAGSGIYVEGLKIVSRVVGVFSDNEVSTHTNTLYLDGVRAEARKHGVQVADFGPGKLPNRTEALVEAVRQMQFGGIIVKFTAGDIFDLGANGHWLRQIKSLSVPLVICRAVPMTDTDTVSPDYFAAFKALGKHLRRRKAENIRFVGQFEVPSFARMHGLRAGLGKTYPLEVEMTGDSKLSVIERLEELKTAGWEGSLVLGTPFSDASLAGILENAPWGRTDPDTFSVVVYENQALPPGIRGHTIVKPSYRLGVASAKRSLETMRSTHRVPRHDVVASELILDGTRRNESAPDRIRA